MYFRRRHLLVCASVAAVNMLLLLHSQASALVITSPPWDSDATQQQQHQQQTQANRRAQEYQTRVLARPALELKIRSTSPDDIPSVANILSHALMEEDELPSQRKTAQTQSNQSPFNFKRRMELLKIKAGVTSLLHSRMETIRVGKMLWERASSDTTLQDLNERERLRFLWSDDTFRTKLERASKLSHEPHTWKGYNFACAPQNADRLCHKMLTAENALTGEIVGFCEVAMLAQPSSSKTVEEPLPTIVNLVTSSDYRRRGVASSILKSASRYVRHQWECEEIALYVQEENNGAVRMYEHLGFETASEARANQLYMKAALSNVAVVQPQQAMAVC